MAATTTPSIHSLINRFSAVYPTLNFEAGKVFAWSPDTQTVQYPQDTHDITSLLHELAHGILGHTEYTKDIELLIKEREAWDYARQTLSTQYNILIDETTAQEALDSYRNWLHARSTCPTCSASGLQTRATTYRCPACAENWRVNEARTCALRRYTQKRHRQ